MKAKLHVDQGGRAQRRFAGRGCSFFGLFALGMLLLAGLLVWLEVLPGRWRIERMLFSQAQIDLERRARHRAARLAGFERETPPAGGILLLGSSTIERFPDAALLEGEHGINRGIGNEDVHKLEARVDRTMERVRPRHVVLYAGSVDVRRAGDDGSWLEVPKILEAVSRVVDALLQSERGDAARKLGVSLVGILPETQLRERVEERRQRVNAGLAALAAKRSRVHFVDVDRAALLVRDARGRACLREALAADTIHLNEAGYALLLEWLREHLRACSAPRDER